MKSRLQSIEIRNFKAFRDFSLNLEGRHLLIYGPNGSGKSSLYWALYTFLQSARKKPKGAINKYFDSRDSENLLNIHEDFTTNPGEIALTLRDTNTNIDTAYRISQADHNTFQKPEILKGDLASDFITYRFFFGFSHFRNSETFDLWPLFEKEILPFCVSTGGKVPLESWNVIKSGIPNPLNLLGGAAYNAYWVFKRNTRVFADMLPGIVDSISNEAQRFYDVNFSSDDPVKITLKLGVTKKPEAKGSNKKDFKFIKPVIGFAIQTDGKTIGRPQSFLNEAKLTQLALSVRFAATLVNLHDSDLKLLVLDDLLVSLDMSNRMKLVEILLSAQFSNYQKIILTHDLGLFREFQLMIADGHTDWCYRKLEGNAREGIVIRNEKSPLQKAEDYLNNHDLEEAAASLRKAAENTAQQYRRFSLKEEIPPGKFHSLSEHLTKVKNALRSRIPINIYDQVLKDTPENLRDKLVRVNNDDIDSDTTIDAAEKDLLKRQRQKLTVYFTKSGWKDLETLKLIEQIQSMTARVLNPASHWNDTAVYAVELKKAMKLIQRLQNTIKP